MNNQSETTSPMITAGYKWDSKSPTPINHALKDGRPICWKPDKLKLTAFNSHFTSIDGFKKWPHSCSKCSALLTAKKAKPRWHVLTHMAGGAENCWTDTNENNESWLVTFATRKDAAAYLTEHLADCRHAVKDGDMSDAPRRSDFTIERVTA
jgi:hypothetical protein